MENHPHWSLELARGDGRVRAARLVCALAVAACVVFLGARAVAIDPPSFSAETECSPVPPRLWSEMPEQGSAHMLLLGDSTDKLWMFQMCSDFLPPEQQCRFTSPTPFPPQNVQPFVCNDGDPRCKATTCFPGDGSSCWVAEEWRSDAACKPLDPHASTIGCAFVPETDQTFDIAAMIKNEAYLSPALSPNLGERVVQAVQRFADFTETRPIVVSLDVMFWWSLLRVTGFSRLIADPTYVTANWDALLQQYREGILGLVDIIQQALRETNRPGIIVAKTNHDSRFPDGSGSLELKLFASMREVLLDIFERDPSHAEKGLYLYDWYGVFKKAAADGKWNMLDDLHQDWDSTRYETEAYLSWAARTLPVEFRPRWRVICAVRLSYSGGPFHGWESSSSERVQMLEGGEGGPRLKHDVDEDEIDGSPLGRLGDPERWITCAPSASIHGKPVGLA